jgi:hypothetical protein
MCRVFRLALLGALLAIPLAAAEPAKSTPVANPPALSPLAQALFQTVICTQGLQPPNCCEPSFDDCNTQYTSVSFVRQKPNGVCVYQCQDTVTCYDSTGCSPGHTTTFGSFRVRSEVGQFPMDGCPAADINFCVTMTVDP